MSVYSLDSLECGNCVSNIATRSNKNSTGNDQKMIEFKADSGSNETVLRMVDASNERRPRVRNAIITKVGCAEVSPRRCTIPSKNRKREETSECPTNRVRDRRNNKTTQNMEKAKTPLVVKDEHSSNPLISLPGRRPRDTSCHQQYTVAPMKPNKKLGNVLPPRIPPARKPRSYLELYHRKFSVPRCSIRSPEGSTLSICGDSQFGELTEDCDSLPGTPRDDSSELSFYRRLIEQSAHRPPETTSLVSAGTSHLPIPRDKNNVSNDKPTTTRTLNYRPYTIQEYKNLPIPKPDRSLGPDHAEIQAKREWLMRRRSYGNTVSARNRQRILLQAQIPKLRGNTLQECFLPPLKDQEVHAKFCSDTSVTSTQLNGKNRDKKERRTDATRNFKETVSLFKTPISNNGKASKKTSSSSSSVNSWTSDTYLEYLKTRHENETKVVNHIISQTLQS